MISVLRGQHVKNVYSIFLKGEIFITKPKLTSKEASFFKNIILFKIKDLQCCYRES